MNKTEQLAAGAMINAVWLAELRQHAAGKEAYFHALGGRMLTFAEAREQVEQHIIMAADRIIQQRRIMSDADGQPVLDYRTFGRPGGEVGHAG